MPDTSRYIGCCDTHGRIEPYLALQHNSSPAVVGSSMKDCTYHRGIVVT